MSDDPGPLPDDILSSDTHRLGELATTLALAWLHWARVNGYYEPSFEQREQDATELARQAIGHYVAELAILGEGQDPIRFATEVLCGAITAAIFVDGAAPPRSTAEQVLALLRSVPRGQSQN
jgi:hypothetical protein